MLKPIAQLTLVTMSAFGLTACASKDDQKTVQPSVEAQPNAETAQKSNNANPIQAGPATEAAKRKIAAKRQATRSCDRQGNSQSCSSASGEASHTTCHTCQLCTGRGCSRCDAAAATAPAAPTAPGLIARVNGVDVDRAEFDRKYEKMTRAFVKRGKPIPPGIS